MESKYRDVTVRRVKVSGGEDLVRYISSPVRESGQGGEVLDFARCREKLEARGALPARDQAEQRPKEMRRRKAARRKKGGLALCRTVLAWVLELAASGAVIAVSAAALRVFFRS